MIYNYELLIIYLTYNNQELIKFYGCDFLGYTKWYISKSEYNRYFLIPFFSAIASLFLLPFSKQCSVFTYKWVKKNVLDKKIKDLQEDTVSRTEYLKLLKEIRLNHSPLIGNHLFVTTSGSIVGKSFSLEFKAENQKVIWTEGTVYKGEFELKNLRLDNFNGTYHVIFTLKKSNGTLNNLVDYIFYFEHFESMVGYYLEFENENVYQVKFRKYN